ncbi:hypothetical protein HO173_004901 [Letharia columbiana]|uniref:MYB transcription factor n=1 Tax=Letharia columbiana TaxID=112416 RepID=A0A8H6FYG9_9LECA|nr:uncharacterized protein HO173_004901 [Letharia columbiana]KAF6237022.1 hypothetical protein HO173_004901 [Letharia columbiana]
MFDDMFDDFQTRPSLRIPPLQDPFPPLSIISRRPSPLEPNARVNIDNEANKLTGRQRALAQAKPLGAPEHNELEASITAKPAALPEAQETEHPKERPRKKQKLYDHEQIADFVQLPRPQTKLREDKPRPFQPISVLNELHEPPPSAALFPPITPNAVQEEHDKYHSGAGQPPNQTKDPGRPPARKRKPRVRSTGSCTAKRIYTRERTAWTEEETDQLVKGVAIYGMGRWKSILNHPELHFREGRTNMDLKDRFRVVFPPNARHKWTRAMPEPPDDDQEAPSGYKFATKGTAKKSPLRAPKRLWTEQEDTELEKGFQLYGFQWNLMLKDPALNFDQRSCGQIRDRFRLRFPGLYKQQDSTASPKENQTSPNKKKHAKSSTGTRKTVDDPNEPANEESDGGARDKTGSKTVPASHTEEEDHRLSNSILHNDWDWDENLTLAPLAWEDMATRPMFPFD